jgi:hypothetical protein
MITLNKGLSSGKIKNNLILGNFGSESQQLLGSRQKQVKKMLGLFRVSLNRFLTRVSFNADTKDLNTFQFKLLHSVF